MSAEQTLRFRWETETRCLLRPAEAAPARERPPLLVALHGQGQSGARHARWMGAAVPDGMAAAFPDGFHLHEVRRPGRPVRVGGSWYVFTGDRRRLIDDFAKLEPLFWRFVDAMAEALGADGERVWLAGFSQGAYLTHTMALRSPERVAGWIGQAGGFRPEYLGERPAPALAGKPVLLQHGDKDEALPLARSEELAGWLRDAGAEVTLQSFDAGHVITPEMATSAHDWLSARLG